MTYDPTFDGIEIGVLVNQYKQKLTGELKTAKYKLEDADWTIVRQISKYLGEGRASIATELKGLEEACQAKLVDVNNAIKSAEAYYSQWKERYEEKMALASEGKPAPPATAKYAKLVTGVLAETEGTQGFAPDDYPVYLGVLTPQAFTDQSTKARHFKDLVSAQHGEYTHRLQWYLCIKKGLFGAKPAGPFFGAVVRFAFLWDHLFDRTVAEPPAAHGKDDFRKPEHLNDWLCQDGQAATEYPVVTAFLRARREKREQLMAPNVKSAYLKDYIARKLFGTLYANVPTPLDKKKVDVIFTSKVLEQAKTT